MDTGMVFATEAHIVRCRALLRTSEPPVVPEDDELDTRTCALEPYRHSSSIYVISLDYFCKSIVQYDSFELTMGSSHNTGSWTLS